MSTVDAQPVDMRSNQAKFQGEKRNAHYCPFKVAFLHPPNCCHPRPTRTITFVHAPINAMLRTQLATSRDQYIIAKHNTRTMPNQITCMKPAKHCTLGNKTITPRHEHCFEQHKSCITNFSKFQQKLSCKCNEKSVTPGKLQAPQVLPH